MTDKEMIARLEEEGDEMTPFEKEVELNALICEREGMVAANQVRAFSEYCPAYDDGDFFRVAEQLRALCIEKEKK